MSARARGLRARWAGAVAALGGGPRAAGFPTSSNRASSFHLHWRGLPPEPLVSASVELEVVVAPDVAHLYFWALQASFADGTGRRGAGHLGLQWHEPHPGHTAVNWGGYARSGRELAGSASVLPSATANPNTRDFAWVPGQAYRLTIGGGDGPGRWRGAVNGVVVRELFAGGDRLVDLMVWSEVFARCDDPSVVVRWRDFTAVTADGRPVHPDGLLVSYQSRADGGCDNTSVEVADGVAQQITAVARQVPADTVLRL